MQSSPVEAMKKPQFSSGLRIEREFLELLTRCFAKVFRSSSLFSFSLGSLLVLCVSA